MLNLILRSSTTQFFTFKSEIMLSLFLKSHHILLNDMTENLEKIKISLKLSYLNHYYFGIFLSSSFSYKAFFKMLVVYCKREFTTSPFSLERYIF